MKEPFKPEPSSKLTFDWVFRQFNAIAEFLNAEGGERAVTHLVFSDSPYTVNSWDEIILGDTAAGVIVVSLPPGVDNRELTIKNIASSGSNVVTVNADGTDDIDREVSSPSTAELAVNEAINITYAEDDANWWIM